MVQYKQSLRELLDHVAPLHTATRVLLNVPWATQKAGGDSLSSLRELSYNLGRSLTGKKFGESYVSGVPGIVSQAYACLQSAWGCAIEFYDLNSIPGAAALMAPETNKDVRMAAFDVIFLALLWYVPSCTFLSSATMV